MSSAVAIPAHLAVHLLGLSVATALAVFAIARRREGSRGWGSVAAGGLVLAVVHLLIGALLVEDLAWPLAARIAGYALIAAGGAGGLRRAREQVTGAAVIAPTTLLGAASTTSHVVAGVAGLAAGVAALRGPTVQRSGRAAALAAGVALWGVGDGLAAAVPEVAVGVSVAGSLLVGGWLFTRVRASLLSRVLTTSLGVLLLLVLGLAALGGAFLGAGLERDERAGLEAVAEARAAEVTDEWTVDLLTLSELFVGQRLADLLGAGDAAALADVAREVARVPNADLVAVLDAEGRTVASFEWVVEPRGALSPSDELALAGDEVVAEALRGGTGRGVVTLGEDGVTALGVSPVFPLEDGEPRRDQLLGALAIGRRVTEPVFLTGVARTADAHATVVVRGEPAGTTLGTRPAQEVAEAVAEGRTGTVEIAGRATFVAASPLRQGDPAAEGGWLVLTRDAGAIADAEQRFTRTLFWMAVAGLLVAGAVASGAARRTTRPVLQLTRAAERVAAGDLDVRTGIDQPDEVGRLADAFDHMTVSLAEREESLRAAAAVEAALRQRLQVLTASMGEGLISVDADGIVRTVNPAAEQLLDLPAESALGTPVSRLLAGRDRSGSSLLEALGGPQVHELRSSRGVLTIGGAATPVAATAAPLRSNGQREGRVYVLRDITSEAQAERMKTEFLSNISHELRTPLTPIRGYAEVLRTRELPHERVVAFADEIADATTRLERIVGMLVDFATFEAGRLDVRLEPTALDEVVDEVLDEWRERRPDRRFSRYLSREIATVQADPRLLTRMLEELIDNAVKFSDGPVRLTAAMDGAGRDEARVRLTVRDEGIGIEPEELGRITEDFQQGDGSATRRYGGLGLGLALVDRIADRLGADVVIDSAADEGTDIHLFLPVAEEGS